MLEEFRSFAELLREPPSQPRTSVDDERAPIASPASCEHEAAIVREMRLFQARIREAASQAIHDVAGDVAATVLARELELRPANIEAIVQRALERFAADRPIAVRCSVADARRLPECPIPVITDDALSEGDVVLELHYGAVDATLGARFASLFAGLAT